MMSGAAGGETMYRIEDTTLITEQGSITFETPIREVVEIKGILVVRLALMRRADDVNNVYGVKDGAIIWRVQPLTEFNPVLLDPVYPQWTPFTGIEVYDEDPDFIFGVAFDGFAYLIDPADGKIIKCVCWVK